MKRMATRNTAATTVPIPNDPYATSLPIWNTIIVVTYANTFWKTIANQNHLRLCSCWAIVAMAARHGESSMLNIRKQNAARALGTPLNVNHWATAGAP